MTVGDVIAALTPWPEDTPVKLRAFCCAQLHEIKVDYVYEGVDSDGAPIMPAVLVLDEGISMWDRPEDIPKPGRQG